MWALQTHSNAIRRIQRSYYVPLVVEEAEVLEVGEDEVEGLLVELVVVVVEVGGGVGVGVEVGLVVVGTLEVEEVVVV